MDGELRAGATNRAMSLVDMLPRVLFFVFTPLPKRNSDEKKLFPMSEISQPLTRSGGNLFQPTAIIIMA